VFIFSGYTNEGDTSETRCTPSHGGAGGGAIEIAALDGDIVLGSTAIVADGASTFLPGLGGGGAGGMVRLKVAGGNRIIVSTAALLQARGGIDQSSHESGQWGDYDGERGAGGGGIVEFGRTSGTTNAIVVYDDDSVDTRSGLHLCSGATCHCEPSCTAEDGKTFLDNVSKSSDAPPTSANDAILNVETVCSDGKSSIVGKSTFNGAGGETV